MNLDSCRVKPLGKKAIVYHTVAFAESVGKCFEGVYSVAEQVEGVGCAFAERYQSRSEFVFYLPDVGQNLALFLEFLMFAGH